MFSHNIQSFSKLWYFLMLLAQFHLK